jgi:hypothetical protein
MRLESAPYSAPITTTYVETTPFGKMSLTEHCGNDSKCKFSRDRDCYKRRTDPDYTMSAGPVGGLNAQGSGWYDTQGFIGPSATRYRDGDKLKDFSMPSWAGTNGATFGERDHSGEEHTSGTGRGKGYRSDRFNYESAMVRAIRDGMIDDRNQARFQDNRQYGDLNASNVNDYYADNS